MLKALDFQTVITTVLVPVNRNRPTGVLVGRISIGGIDEKLEAFAEVSLLLRVHGDETEPTRLLVSKIVAMFLGSHLGIADGVDVNLIAESIKILTGVFAIMGRTVPVTHAFDFVWTPPARITRSDRRSAERPVRVTLLGRAILGHRGEMLIAVDVQCLRLAENINGPVARRLRPGT